MKRNELVYIGHMLDMAQKVVEKNRGKSRADFAADENLRMASTHLIQIIGEAASRTSAKFREKYPEVPWPEIIGMRLKVVHNYIDVNYDIVWDVIITEIPELIPKLEKIFLAEKSQSKK